MPETPKFGKVVHFDLIVNDTAEAGNYYAGASDWDIGAGSATYKPATPVEGTPGGLWNNSNTEIENTLIAYFLVSKVDDFVAAPPEGFTILESGTHPEGVPYAIAESKMDSKHGLVIGVMEA